MSTEIDSISDDKSCTPQVVDSEIEEVVNSQPSLSESSGEPCQPSTVHEQKSDLRTYETPGVISSPAEEQEKCKNNSVQEINIAQSFSHKDLENPSIISHDAKSDNVLEVLSNMSSCTSDISLHRKNAGQFSLLEKMKVEVLDSTLESDGQGADETTSHNGGCLMITMPLYVLDECRGKSNQLICLKGSCTNLDSDNTNEVQVYMESKKDSVCLSLYASAMGSLFQEKLSQHWTCVINNVATTVDEQHSMGHVSPTQPQHSHVDLEPQNSLLPQSLEDSTLYRQPVANVQKRGRGRPKGSVSKHRSKKAAFTSIKMRPKPVTQLVEIRQKALDVSDHDVLDDFDVDSNGGSPMSFVSPDSPEILPAKVKVKRGRPSKHMGQANNKSAKIHTGKKARAKGQIAAICSRIKSEDDAVNRIKFDIERGEAPVTEQLSEMGEASIDIIHDAPKCEIRGEIVSSDTEEQAKYKHKIKTDRKLNTKLYIQNKKIAHSMNYDISTGAQICIICSQVHSLGFHLLVHLRRFHIMSPGDYLNLLELPKEDREMRIVDLQNLAHIPQKKQFPKRAGSLPCDFCGVMCIGIQNMKRHLMLAHRTEKDLPEKIEQYKAIYARLIHNNRMIAMRKENQIKDYPCRYCGLVLAMSSTRSRHQMYTCPKNPNRLKRIHCNYCGTSFRTQEILEKHQKKHAAHDFKYVCDICGKVSKSKPMMYEHKMIVHKGRPPKFTCPYSDCGKAFQYKDQLSNHVVKHSDKRDFMCDLCGKFFKTTSDVSKHTKFVHEGIYPYHCEKCGHGVAKISYLKSHKCGRVRRARTEHVDGELFVPKQRTPRKGDKNRIHKKMTDDDAVEGPLNPQSMDYSNSTEQKHIALPEVVNNVDSSTVPLSSDSTPVQQYAVLPNTALSYAVDMHNLQSSRYAMDRSQQAYARQSGQMMPPTFPAGQYGGAVPTGLFAVYPMVPGQETMTSQSITQIALPQSSPAAMDSNVDYSKYTQFHLPPQ